MLTMILFAFSSCEKEDSEDQVNVGMSLKVNGTLKQAAGETKVSAMFIKSEKSLQVMGNLGENEAVSLTIENFNGVGDYNVTNDNVVVVYTTNINGGVASTSLGTTGIIKITTSTDKVIKGTFQFTDDEASTPMVISEGKFEAKVMTM